MYLLVMLFLCAGVCRATIQRHRECNRLPLTRRTTPFHYGALPELPRRRAWCRRRHSQHIETRGMPGVPRCTETSLPLGGARLTGRHHQQHAADVEDGERPQRAAGVALHGGGVPVPAAEQTLHRARLVHPAQSAAAAARAGQLWRAPTSRDRRTAGAGTECGGWLRWGR